MRALIDADIVVYRVAWTTENDDEGIARYRTDELIQKIQDSLEAPHYDCYLTSSDKSNFRLQLDPQYKANRANKPKPKHYLYLRNYLIEAHKAIVVEGQEADDALGIECTQFPQDTIICSIDKDLDQIPGWHYNFVKLRKYHISPVEALRCFYQQVLVGDKSTDNVEGCPGIGEAKATRILEGCQDETEMLRAVRHEYGNRAGPDWLDKLLLAGRLLWIRQHGKQEWTFRGSPVSRLLLEHFSKIAESTSSMKNESSPINSSHENTIPTSK